MLTCLSQCCDCLRVACRQYAWMLFTRPEAFVVLSVPYLRKSATMSLPAMPQQPLPPASPSVLSAMEEGTGGPSKASALPTHTLHQEREAFGLRTVNPNTCMFNEAVGEGGLWVGTRAVLSELRATRANSSKALNIATQHAAGEAYNMTSNLWDKSDDHAPQAPHIHAS